jgi:hypothetical protein
MNTGDRLLVGVLPILLCLWVGNQASAAPIDMVGRDEPRSGSPLRSLAVVWHFRASALTE